MQTCLTPKILLIMTAREIGGAELYVERLVTALGTSCQFTIVISDHPKMNGLAQLLQQQCNIIQLSFERLATLVNCMLQLRKLASQHDLLHLNSNHPASRLGIAIAFTLSKTKAPLVCVEHSATHIDSIVIPQILKPILPILFRLSRRKVSKTIAVSQENKNTLISTYGLNSKTIEVVYNGIQIRSQNLTSKLPQTILVLARLMPSKGHRYLIDAAPAILQHFTNARFIFAGAPDQLEPINSQIRELELTNQFEILGFRNDVPDLLAKADMFVLPSLAEGFSLSIIEAMAAGCLVVATRVGGAAEIIEHGVNGFLVPPADSAALTAAINTAFSLEPVAKNVMRKNAMQTAQQFSVEKMAQQTLAVYQEALNHYS